MHHFKRENLLTLQENWYLLHHITQKANIILQTRHSKNSEEFGDITALRVYSINKDTVTFDCEELKGDWFPTRVTLMFDELLVTDPSESQQTLKGDCLESQKKPSSYPRPTQKTKGPHQLSQKSREKHDRAQNIIDNLYK